MLRKVIFCKRKIPYILLTLIIFNMMMPIGRVFGQVVAGSGWSEPTNLSNTIASSSSPEIVADNFGMVHVFWIEDLYGEPHIIGSAPRYGNAIMYRSFYDGEWSPTVDIVYTGELGRINALSAVVDRNGVLHLVWNQGDELHYSNVSAWKAGQVNEWSEPYRISSEGVTQVHISDNTNGVIVICSRSRGDESGLFAVQISDDGSISNIPIWSAPRESLPRDIAVAVDGRGRLHVVWSLINLPDIEPTEVYYSRSEDNGNTWSEHELIAHEAPEGNLLRFAVPWVAARGNDEIHLQWAQGPLPYRWHRYSIDGGVSWTQSYQIWPKLHSQSNSRAIGVDGDGVLHWIDLLRYPNGGFHTYWQENGWRFPQLIYLMQQDPWDELGERINAHRFRLAISQGNQLHVMFQDQDRAEIWTMNRTLSSSAHEPDPKPEFILLPTPEEVIHGNSEITNTDFILNTQNNNIDITQKDQVIESNPGNILVLGTIPVILIIAVIFVRKKIVK